MKLIVGLGNPGKEYENTRHNVGFVVVNGLANSGNEKGIWQKHSKNSETNRPPEFQDAILLKPQTFMNESGKSVMEVAQFYKVDPSDIWVVHDDLDLTLDGTVRISYDASAAGHNGVQSIIDSLGTKAFWRFRLGIGRPTTQQPTDSFVLGPFKSGELESFAAEIVRAKILITKALEVGIEQTRQTLNQIT